MFIARLLACMVALSVLAPTVAVAQGQPRPSAKDARARARELADEGYEHYQAGRYADALAAFRKAEQGYHAPTILLMVARSYERLGRLLEARAIYETVVAERLDPKAPEAFREAQQTAQAELGSLNRRIPTLQIVVSGAPANQVSLTLDGAPVSASGEPIAINPGRAVVHAEIAGQPPVERIIELQEGRSERLTLHLGKPEAPRPPPERSRREPQASASVLPAAITLGFAGVGLAVGGVTGIVAKVRIDDIKSRCTSDGHCLVADEPGARSAERLAGVSTVAFVAGGIAAAGGAALLLLRSRAEAPPAQQKAGVHLVLGPGSAMIAGRF